jgi:hypothetical protein
MISIFICLAAFFWLLRNLRSARISFGLPIAYLYLLLLIHVPGAASELLSKGFCSEETATGIYFTAIGAVSFVVGVALSGTSALTPINYTVNRARYRKFCLFGGWGVVYGLSPLAIIPTLGAAVNTGGAIWILGVLLGLRTAFERWDLKSLTLWVGALSVYPILMLLLGGFVSFGATSIVIAGSVIGISSRRYWHAVVGVIVITFFGLSVFVNYFLHRQEIRQAVWGGATMAERVDPYWVQLTILSGLTMPI